MLYSLLSKGSKKKTITDSSDGKVNKKESEICITQWKDDKFAVSKAECQLVDGQKTTIKLQEQNIASLKHKASLYEQIYSNSHSKVNGKVQATNSLQQLNTQIGIKEELDKSNRLCRKLVRQSNNQPIAVSINDSQCMKQPSNDNQSMQSNTKVVQHFLQDSQNTVLKLIRQQKQVSNTQQLQFTNLFVTFNQIDNCKQFKAVKQINYECKASNSKTVNGIIPNGTSNSITPKQTDKMDSNITLQSFQVVRQHQIKLNQQEPTKMVIQSFANNTIVTPVLSNPSLPLNPFNSSKTQPNNILSYLPLTRMCYRLGLRVKKYNYIFIQQLQKFRTYRKDTKQGEKQKRGVKQYDNNSYEQQQQQEIKEINRNSNNDRQALLQPYSSNNLPVLLPPNNISNPPNPPTSLTIPHSPLFLFPLFAPPHPLPSIQSPFLPSHYKSNYDNHPMMRLVNILPNSIQVQEQIVMGDIRDNREMFIRSHMVEAQVGSNSNNQNSHNNNNPNSNNQSNQNNQNNHSNQNKGTKYDITPTYNNSFMRPKSNSIAYQSNYHKQTYQISHPSINYQNKQYSSQLLENILPKYQGRNVTYIQNSIVMEGNHTNPNMMNPNNVDFDKNLLFKPISQESTAIIIQNRLKNNAMSKERNKFVKNVHCQLNNNSNNNNTNSNSHRKLNLYKMQINHIINNQTNKSTNNTKQQVRVQNNNNNMNHQRIPLLDLTQENNKNHNQLQVNRNNTNINSNISTTNKYTNINSNTSSNTKPANNNTIQHQLLRSKKNSMHHMSSHNLSRLGSYNNNNYRKDYGQKQRQNRIVLSKISSNSNMSSRSNNISSNYCKNHNKNSSTNIVYNNNHSNQLSNNPTNPNNPNNCNNTNNYNNYNNYNNPNNHNNHSNPLTPRLKPFLSILHPSSITRPMSSAMKVKAEIQSIIKGRNILVGGVNSINSNTINSNIIQSNNNNNINNTNNTNSINNTNHNKTIHSHLQHRNSHIIVSKFD